MSSCRKTLIVGFWLVQALYADSKEEIPSKKASIFSEVKALEPELFLIDQDRLSPSPSIEKLHNQKKSLKQRAKLTSAPFFSSFDSDMSLILEDQTLLLIEHPLSSFPSKACKRSYLDFTHPLSTIQLKDLHYLPSYHFPPTHCTSEKVKKKIDLQPIFPIYTADYFDLSTLLERELALSKEVNSNFPTSILKGRSSNLDRLLSLKVPSKHLPFSTKTKGVKKPTVERIKSFATQNAKEIIQFSKNAIFSDSTYALPLNPEKLISVEKNQYYPISPLSHSRSHLDEVSHLLIDRKNLPLIQTAKMMEEPNRELARGYHFERKQDLLLTSSPSLTFIKVIPTTFISNRATIVKRKFALKKSLIKESEKGYLSAAFLSYSTPSITTHSALYNERREDQFLLVKPQEALPMFDYQPIAFQEEALIRFEQMEMISSKEKGPLLTEVGDQTAYLPFIFYSDLNNRIVYSPSLDPLSTQWNLLPAICEGSSFIFYSHHQANRLPKLESTDLFLEAANKDAFLIKLPSIGLDPDIVATNRKLNAITRETTEFLSTLSNKSEYPLSSLSDQFNVRVELARLGGGQGHGIVLKVEPKIEAALEQIDQTMIFVIDRSRGTPESHTRLYSEAVSKALSSLSPEVKFNIYFIDKTIERFTSNSTYATKEKIRDAKNFLINQTATSSKQGIDPYTFLNQLMANSPLEDSGITTVFLLSDMANSKGPAYHTKDIHTLIEQNRDKFFLYTTTCNPSAIKELQVLSTLGKGEYIEYKKSIFFVRAFSSQVKKLRTPLLTYVTVTTPNSNLQLFNSPHTSTPLFQSQPYAIYGLINKLEPFEILIQANIHNNVVHIRKKIDPTSGLTVSTNIKQTIDRLNALKAYTTFIQSGHIDRLNKANTLLSPYDIQIE